MQLRKNLQFRDSRLDDLPRPLVHRARAIDCQSHDGQLIGVFLATKLPQFFFYRNGFSLEPRKSSAATAEASTPTRRARRAFSAAITFSFARAA